MEGALPFVALGGDNVDNAQLLSLGADGDVHLPGGPEGDAFLRADFSRAGPDLLIDTPDGDAFVVPGYFMAATPPALVIGDGAAVLTPKIVTALAGPLAPAQLAQAADGAAQQGIGLGEPIGQVSEAEGAVNVTHSDGAKGALALGDNVFQGDVLETGPEGSVSIVFIDDTIFSLNGDGRMVMDEMVYDPGTQVGAFNAVVVQGVFSFVSGQIAKTSPEGMVVDTPNGSIGIRGSTVLGRFLAGEETKITLVRDVDGNVGEIVISNSAGTMVLNQAGATTTLFDAFTAPTPVVILSPQEIQQDFGQNLTRLVKVVAKKAQQDAQRATEKADKIKQEAEQAGEKAAKAEDEAAQAEADAEAALAEAEAAKAAAEAAGDEEALAKAAAAEAKAAEALQKATDAKAAAEAAAAEAAAKAAEAEVAQAQAQQAQQFSSMADTAFSTQAQAFAQAQQLAGEAGKANQIQGDGKAKPPLPTFQDLEPTPDPLSIAKLIQIVIAKPLPLPLPPPPPPPPPTPVASAYGETIVAPPGGGTLAGTSINTNFYFHWGAINAGANYTIVDAGGVDQISFDSLNNVIAKAVFSAVATAGQITTYTFSSGTLSTDIATAVRNTVNFSGIDQFLLSDISVAGLAVTDYQTTAGGSVLVLGDMHPSDTGYVIAGNDNANTITIDVAMDGAVIFAKGGNDTIYVNVVADGLDILGGAGIDTLSYVNLGVGIFASLSSTNKYVVDYNFMDTYDPAFKHTLKGIENLTGTAYADDVDLLSGTYGTIDTGTGYDAVFIHELATYTSITLGDGDDYVEVLASEFSNIVMTSVNGGNHINGDTFGLNVGYGTAGTYLMTDYQTQYDAVVGAGPGLGFEYAALSAYDATQSVTLTAWGSGGALDGGLFGDTLNGGAGNDVLIGGGGADILTGGGGSNVFIYEETYDEWGVFTGGDSITDFVVGTDKMHFLSAGFGNLATGTLAAGNFISGAGAVATTATEYFIYDTSTDILFYDADGSGAGASVVIADLTGITGAAFTEADIQIV